MRLLFDLVATQPCGDSKFHGGGEYAKIIFKHIVAKGYGKRLTCFYDPALALDEEISRLVQLNQITLLPINSHAELSLELNSGNYYAFYSALPYHYHDLDTHEEGPKLIYTIHGLRQIELPSDRYEIKFRKGMREKLKVVLKILLKTVFIRRKKSEMEKILASKSPLEVIVPSYHTKYSMMNFFPHLMEKRLKVMYSPRKIEDAGEHFDLERYGLEPGKYFLIISGNRWLKNGFRAVKALDEVYSAFETNIKTVVLGVRDRNRFYKSIRNPHMFVFLDYVNGGQLDFFYRNAFCFVYPTLNEGFGYPPLESMRHGVPVIASSITSVSEVCRDGVSYFNPFSVEEIKTRIVTMLFDAPQRAALARRGREVYEAVAGKQDEDLERLVELLFGAEESSGEGEENDDFPGAVRIYNGYARNLEIG